MKNGCLLGSLGVLIEREVENICNGCGHTYDECIHSNKISVDYSSYVIKKLETPLPATKAWCRDCATNSSKPIAFVHFNRKTGIVLECTKCKSRYVMYLDDYKRNYIGFTKMEWGYSKEEAIERVNEQEKERQEIRSKFNKEITEMSFKRKEENALKEAKTKSELIKQGIIIYDKTAKCLIDTRTNEVVKL